MTKVNLENEIFFSEKKMSIIGGG